jgi:hypothetical protein
MVQQSSFCSKASEDANAHLQHFLEICSTFTIQVTQDTIRLRLFPFSMLEKVKQWFHSNKEAVSTKISGFQQLTDETIAEAWECL